MYIINITMKGYYYTRTHSCGRYAHNDSEEGSSPHANIRCSGKDVRGELG